jgi:hypothetical protein
MADPSLHKPVLGVKFQDSRWNHLQIVIHKAVSDVDYAQEEVLIQEASDSEH